MSDSFAESPGLYISSALAKLCASTRALRLLTHAFFYFLRPDADLLVTELFVVCLLHLELLLQAVREAFCLTSFKRKIKSFLSSMVFRWVACLVYFLFFVPFLGWFIKWKEIFEWEIAVLTACTGLWIHYIFIPFQNPVQFLHQSILDILACTCLCFTLNAGRTIPTGTFSRGFEYFNITSVN